MTEDIDLNKIFVAEASKSAVIDTACTKKLQEKNGINILKPTNRTTT